jgi:hypothetical protein
LTNWTDSLAGKRKEHGAWRKANMIKGEKGDVATQKPPRLNTLEGDPSEMRYARHGHEFNGVNPVQLGREGRWQMADGR